MTSRARAAGRRSAQGAHLARTSYRLTATLLRRMFACLAATMAAIAAVLLVSAAVRILLPTPTGWWTALFTVALVAVAVVVASRVYLTTVRGRRRS